MNFKNILILAKKEWWSLLYNPTGYVFSALLLLVTNWLFVNDMFVIGQADIKPYLSTMLFLLIIFVPAITMNSLAEEKKSGTWEILLSLPVNETEMVVGKLLGWWWYFGLVLVLSTPVAGILIWLGQPDLGVMAGGYVAVLLVGLAYGAIGILASALTNQPVVGFLIGTMIILVNNVMGQDAVVSRMPGQLAKIVTSLSLGWQTNRMMTGAFELTDLVFFGSATAVAVIITVLILKARDK